MKQKKRIRKLEERIHLLESDMAGAHASLKSVIEYLNQGGTQTHSSPYNHVPKMICGETVQ